MDYDFSGWATRNNIECSDGRTIMRDAFKQNDGQKVPLVWNHDHNSPDNVLGHALLENREDGVYAYCKFNETESGQQAKALVVNGDVDKLSIYANKLKSNMNKVIHGCIREVSLVLAGANPGAYIDSVITHGEGADAEEEVVIYTDENISVDVEESEDNSQNEQEESEGGENVEDNKEMVDVKEEGETMENTENKDYGEVFESMTDEQKEAVYAIVGEALEEAGVELVEEDEEIEEESNEETDEDNEESEEEGEDTNMKHNVFDKDTNKKEETLMHSEIVANAIADAKRYGSMRESFIEHAAINNIDNMEILFPDAHPLNYEPKMIEEDNSWVAKIMRDVKHSPFSRVKATFGRLTEPEARAKGYIKKGEKKVNIKMAVLNRVTTPTTVYIKNEIDRDDVIDIKDFDVVAWQKKEMRKQLDKELARAMLLGDDRDPSDPYKISELAIRPVLNDDETYTIQYVVTEGVDYKINENSYSENDSKTKGVIRAAIKSRRNYKGSGKPTLYTTEGFVNDALLIEDQNGRVIYESIDKLATAMRVKEIVTIPEMEAYTDIYGIIVNMNDYTAGADKGGSVNMFDDFDIDYNQMKYMMETRMSGALTVPYSAIVLRKTAKADDEAEG
jgi:HK97 family phage prohead protease